MKKIFLSIFFVAAFIFFAKAQHIVPVEVSTNPSEVEIAIFGAATADGGASSFKESFTSKGDFGFALNALVRKDEGKWGKKITYKQFIVNLNPVIIDWNSFDINLLVKDSMDQFNVQRMPFAEDCFLHIGFRSNSIAKIKQGGTDQFNLYSLWADLFYRPYAFESQLNPGTSLSFQTFNFNFGYQYNFFKTNIPVIETFMIGLSPQICYMGVNEAEAAQGSFAELYGDNQYNGQNYIGGGGKLIVQTKNLNIFIDGRQYVSVDADYSGKKFMTEPTIMVGVYGNVNFYTKAPIGADDDDFDTWD